MAKSEKTEQDGKPTTKMEAIRRALAELGQNAKPHDIQSYVRAKFGIEMNTNVVSAYKSTLKAAKQPAEKPTTSATAPAANGAQAVKTPAPRTEGVVSVDDIIAIKELADRIGADHLKKLVDVLGK